MMNVVLLLFVLALTEGESILESSPLENIRKQELETEETQIRSHQCCLTEMDDLRRLIEHYKNDTYTRTNEVNRRLKDEISSLTATVTDLRSRVHYLESGGKWRMRKIEGASRNTGAE